MIERIEQLEKDSKIVDSNTRIEEDNSNENHTTFNGENVVIEAEGITKQYYTDLILDEINENRSKIRTDSENEDSPTYQFCFTKLLEVGVFLPQNDKRILLKKAKFELDEMSKLGEPRNLDEMVDFYERKNELSKIIYSKKKINTFAKKGEIIPLDARKLTFIEFVANGDTLQRLCSPNGKPLSTKAIKEFHEKVEMPLKAHASKTLDEDKNYSATYSLYYSNDKTKNKSFQAEDLFYQIGGQPITEY